MGSAATDFIGPTNSPIAGIEAAADNKSENLWF